MIDPNFLLDLARLQKQLITSFKRLYPAVLDSEWLVGCPVSGEVQIDKERWAFVKHGAGLTFMRSNLSPRLVVDMHSQPWNIDLVDAWRLQQFVESMGTAISFEEAKAALDEACNAGKASRDAHGAVRVLST